MVVVFLLEAPRLFRLLHVILFYHVVKERRLLMHTQVVQCIFVTRSTSFFLSLGILLHNAFVFILVVAVVQNEADEKEDQKDYNSQGNEEESVRLSWCLLS
jgi:predicted membrane protein